jgi:hypothetical protein
MTTIEAILTTIQHFDPNPAFDEAQLAAAAFLARYGGRTLDAYQHELRAFFQRAADTGLAVLQARKPHVELYRAAMGEPPPRRRRLSTDDSRQCAASTGSLTSTDA